MASEASELPNVGEEIIVFRYQLPTPGELALLRDKASLTKRDVAGRMDVNRHTIRNWETGEFSPRINEVKRLLEIYRDEITGETAPQ